MDRKQVAVRLAVAISAVAIVAVATVLIVRRSNSAIRAPRPEQRVFPGSVGAGDVASTAPRLDAPVERRGIDDGVADAARKFAIQFVTPELKFPQSASFPESSIRLERFGMMNNSTGDTIEHWYVDGAVDAINDYGVQVRSWWRIMIGREADTFFPVVVSLEGAPVYQMSGHVAMLQDARRDNQQRKTDEANAKKAKELAANRAVWQANAAAKPAEQKAREELKLAVDLLESGRREPAVRRLQAIIEKYPDTSAAGEAQVLLDQ